VAGEGGGGGRRRVVRPLWAAESKGRQNRQQDDYFKLKEIKCSKF
jgi:hypothetical protein